MPADIEGLLKTRKLSEAYAARPPYRRNDYLMWIEGAQRPETRHKRIARMLDELEAGDVYMKVAWRPGR